MFGPKRKLVRRRTFLCFYISPFIKNFAFNLYCNLNTCFLDLISIFYKLLYISIILVKTNSVWSKDSPRAGLSGVLFGFPGSNEKGPKSVAVSRQLVFC